MLFKTKYSFYYIYVMLEKISTKELATFMDVSEGFVSQIKKGRRKLPPKYCILVSKQYGIPLHSLRPDIYPEIK